MKVVVLCGGTSTERNVSISSGTLICKALKENGHDTILMDVYKGLPEYESVDEKVFELDEKGLGNVVEDVENVPDISQIKREDSDVFFGPNVLEICKLSDIVFMALHGENGENGKIQATFDLLGIKYTGSGYEASMIAMNKDLTRKILISSGIKMAKGITLCGQDNYQEISNKLFVPAVVKPANGGSSVGVAIVNTFNELENAIKKARAYDDIVIVEEYIKGREFSVGVIDKKALPIIEIIPKQGFYDYKNKYKQGFAEEICPANLDEKTTEQMKKISEDIYRILRFDVYARIDFILSTDGIIYCLEANTLPGMTPTSLLPQEASKEGLSYSQLCEKIIELSLKK